MLGVNFLFSISCSWLILLKGLGWGGEAGKQMGLKQQATKPYLSNYLPL